MKNFIVFASAMLLTVNCSAGNEVREKTNNDTILVSKTLVQRISLSERTRGTNRSFTISPAKVETNMNGTLTSKSLPADSWKMISDKIEQINLDEIKSYNSPTTKRYSDAALASVITIEKDGKTYSSSEFDSGNPPQQLRDLYMSIQNAAGTKKGGN